MPARTRLTAIRCLLVSAAVVGAAAVSGCGPLPPQAPVAQASTISSALTTIIAACGESYRLQAFHPGADLSSLDATAASSAGKLAGISAKHPAWVYQGKTLAQIDALSVDQLKGCSLTRAARVLKPHANS
jgi:hypothetical protein